VLLLIYRIIKLAGGAEFATQQLLQHLRTAKEGVAIFDVKRRLVFANPLFSEYADLISSMHLANVEDILAQPEFARIRRFIDSGGYLNNVHETMLSENVEVSGHVFDLRCVLFRDKGFEISINDITAAEEQSRMKRQLTQNIAHEFKTPVCSIQGYLETIIQNYPDNLTDEQLMHFLSRCHSQSNRLNALVQDISQLNEMSGAVQRVSKEPVNLSQLVENMLQEVNERMSALEMNVENNLPQTLMINADPLMIYSIFRNLMDNAMAYAGNGSVVRIACFRSDGQFYYFTFADNGVGVPEEHLSRIFERFYRVDKGRSRKLGGTGLGLAIVKNAVLLHGGTIYARNAVDGGLEFVFKLQR
jgi:two-component system OmpR family sensor kinase/two-component system phosphate regulon sensor histidine kinase PhoR